MRRLAYTTWLLDGGGKGRRADPFAGQIGCARCPVKAGSLSLHGGKYEMMHNLGSCTGDDLRQSQLVPSLCAKLSFFLPSQTPLSPAVDRTVPRRKPALDWVPRGPPDRVISQHDNSPPSLIGADSLALQRSLLSAPLPTSQVLLRLGRNSTLRLQPRVNLPLLLLLLPPRPLLAYLHPYDTEGEQPDKCITSSEDSDGFDSLGLGWGEFARWGRGEDGEGGGGG